MEDHTREYESKAQPFAPDFDIRKGFDAKSSRLAIERAEGVTHIITSPTGGIISGQGAYVDFIRRINKTRKHYGEKTNTK